MNSYVVGGPDDESTVHRLNEERRAILAEVDNAKFSSVAGYIADHRD